MDALNSNYCSIHVLPEETLPVIFNKQDTVNVLYSLVKVNEQFDRLVLNSHYLHNLNMVNVNKNPFLVGYVIKFYLEYMNKLTD